MERLRSRFTVVSALAFVVAIVLPGGPGPAAASTADGSTIDMRLSELVLPSGDGITAVVVATDDTPEGVALIDDLLARVRPV
jgi:hypothetical protein